MRREHHAEHLEAELPGIGLWREVSRVDRLANGLGDRAAQFTLSGGDQVANGAGTVVVFDGRREHEAATREGPLQPVEPMREEGAKPGQPRDFAEGGLDDLLLKEPVRRLERE